MSIETIGVAGCGMMGSGIAEVAASSGFAVVAVKLTGGPLHEVASRIRASLDRAVAKNKMTAQARDEAIGRISFTDDVAALESCDLVVENAVEALAEKKRVLLNIEKELAPDALLATNTSSLPLAHLGNTLERPIRFLGLHFFSPVSKMPLVEVAPFITPNEEVVTPVNDAIRRMGKTPVVTRSDPGYVVNRLLVPYLCQGIEMLESGLASAKDIDEAMKLGCGHPMGPLELCDFIGLDVVLAMAVSLGNELHDKRFRVPSLLRQLVVDGRLGKKTGSGLCNYQMEAAVHK
jgi:3-hydroxybutyryl-CoA dehydrogenase